MLSKVKIALCIPGSPQPEKYFSLRLRHELYNEASEYSKPSKIFAISDIEGNFQALYKLLLNNQVIDKHYQWIFGDGHLVIAGDCLDRGDQVIECLWFIYSLEERAKKKGGHVHFILGNHEIMNMNGDWRYVHPKYAQKAKTSKNPPVALYYGNNEMWRWLRTKNIIEKIGDTLFVHGGIASEVIRLKLSVTDINNIARPYYMNATDTFADPFLSVIYGNDYSPFWYRGYYDGGETEEQIDMVLTYFGISTIITGHTMIDKVSSFYNGKVINIDTDHAAGRSEALLINGDQFYRVNTEGEKEKIK